MRFLIPFLFLTNFFIFLWGSNPVPYSGKVSINGVNYHGEAQFTFALQDKDGKVRWRNGTDGEKKSGFRSLMADTRYYLAGRG